MSGVAVSKPAQRFVVALAMASAPEQRRRSGPTVAALMRSLGINRRTAKAVIAELVELAWIHRQRGIWELQPEGANAAVWYREHGWVVL